MSALAVDPQDTQTVCAGTPYGVYKSTDGGRSWAPSRQGLGAVGIGSLAVDPQAPRMVYAAGGHKVFRSTNGGRSWRSFTRGLPSLAVQALAISGNGGVLYAGTAGGGVSDYKLP